VGVAQTFCVSVANREIVIMMSWRGFAVLGLMLAANAGCVRPAPPRSNIRLALPNTTAAAAPTSPSSGVRATERVPSTQPVPPKVENPKLTVTPEAGVVSGQVRWEGPLPGDAGPRMRVEADGGVANAVLWIVKAPKPAVAGPGAVEVIDQQRGQLTPRLRLGLVGTRLKLTTSDEKANIRANGAAEFAVSPRPQKPQERKLDKAGLVRLESELDPAATAHVWVFDHLCFDATDEKGHFRLRETLPPGKYELVLWHEGWRPGAAPVEKRATIEVGADKGVGIDWVLKGQDGEKN